VLVYTGKYNLPTMENIFKKFEFKYLKESKSTKGTPFSGFTGAFSL